MKNLIVLAIGIALVRMATKYFKNTSSNDIKSFIPKFKSVVPKIKEAVF